VGKERRSVTKIDLKVEGVGHAAAKTSGKNRRLQTEHTGGGRKVVGKPQEGPRLAQGATSPTVPMPWETREQMASKGGVSN